MDEPTRKPLVQTNRVVLNIGHHGGVEPPEPGQAAVTVDGTPLHGVRSLLLQAGVDQITVLSIVFECEVSGVIAGKSFEEIIRESQQ